jgi:hypothetical protein
MVMHVTEMRKNLATTMAVLAAITLAATMATFAGITTITQQASAQPSNTNNNLASCSQGGTGNTQLCSISQGACQIAAESIFGNLAVSLFGNECS